MTRMHLALMVLTGAATVAAHAQYALITSTIAPGGGHITSGDYELTATIGQTVSPMALGGGDYVLSSGFIAQIPVPSDCAGDADGDGSVNFADLEILLEAWATSVPPGTNGDIDGSGFVDFTDLAELLEYWGTSCD